MLLYFLTRKAVLKLVKDIDIGTGYYESKKLKINKAVLLYFLIRKAVLKLLKDIDIGNGNYESDLTISPKSKKIEFISFCVASI